MEEHLAFIRTRVDDGSTPSTETNIHPARPSKTCLSLLCSSGNTNVAFRAVHRDVYAVVEIGGGGGIESTRLCSVDCDVVGLACSECSRILVGALEDGGICCWDVTGGAMRLKERWRLSGSFPPCSDDQSRLKGSSIVSISSLAVDVHCGVVLLVDLVEGCMKMWRISNGSLVSYGDNSAWCRDNEYLCISSACFCRGSSFILAGCANGGDIRVYDICDGSLVKASLGDKPDFISECGEDCMNQWNCTYLHVVAFSRHDEDDKDPTKFTSWALVAGYSKLEPAIEEEYDGLDLDDDDDPSMLEVNLCIANLMNGVDDRGLTLESSWFEIGDPAPFFGVPIQGRHIFFATFVQTSSTSEYDLLLVGSNVSNDVGTIIYQRSNQKWEFIELQDGKALTMPVTDDDEQIFPTGLTKLISKENSDAILYLSSTDNGLSKVILEHATKDKFAQGMPWRDITIIDEVSLSESVIETFLRSKKESESLSSSLASFSLTSSKNGASDTSVPTQTSLPFQEKINLQKQSIIKDEKLATRGVDSKLFAGKTAREMLTEFYERNNPQKVNDVEKLLNKYKGNEEQMFRNLALKYNLKPTEFGLNDGTTPLSATQSTTPIFGSNSAHTLSFGDFATNSKAKTNFGNIQGMALKMLQIPFLS